MSLGDEKVQKNLQESRNLKENKDLISEKHTKKSAKSKGTMPRNTFSIRGQAQLDARLLDVVKRIQEYQNNDFGEGEVLYHLKL